jgi:hypothetical protein
LKGVLTSFINGLSLMFIDSIRKPKDVKTPFDLIRAADHVVNDVAISNTI